MENKMSTHALVEGALMAGLAVIFALLGMLPIVGAFTIIISGIPITIATARHGTFTGALSAILATLLIALLLGPLSALSYGLENMLLGFVFGYMLYKRKSGAKILQAGIISAAIASVIIMGVSLAIMGFSPDAIAAYMTQTEAEMMELYESTGLLDAMMAQQQMSTVELTAMLQGMIAVMVKLSPAMMIISNAFIAVVVYLITIQVLKRLKIRIPRTAGISSWRLPFSTIWFIIVVWALWLMGDRIAIEWVNLLAMNGMLICAALLFMNGLTAAIHVFGITKMSAGMKVLTVFMVFFFITGFLIGLVLLGIADLLFDFRSKKVDNNKESK